MIALAFETNSHKEKILEFLDEFNWKPESIEDKDGQYNITLIAKLDIKQIKINIKFSETSHWIYFSSLFLESVTKNQKEIYYKLLQLNYSTTLTKFGITKNGVIYALIELPLHSLEFEDFISGLRRLTNDINKYLIPIATLNKEDK
tara:strand:+ start:848 stop:1285 length:438 start_codon:yes stop_codon:yes gene_type:complete